MHDSAVEDEVIVAPLGEVGGAVVSHRGRRYIIVNEQLSPSEQEEMILLLQAEPIRLAA